MEPEGSLQTPATRPYPEPTPSSPQNPFPLLQDIYIYNFCFKYKAEVPLTVDTAEAVLLTSSH